MHAQTIVMISMELKGRICPYTAERVKIRLKGGHDSLAVVSPPFSSLMSVEVTCETKHDRDVTTPLKS